MPRLQVTAGTKSSPRPRAYDLEVCILTGLLTDSFVKDNPTICRNIRIRGDQTLQDLHDAIFDAFDRSDEHMYEFQIGGKRPMDPKARCDVLPAAEEFDSGAGRAAGTVDKTTLDSLNLKPDDAFAYWFDFGDDWWHQVTVLAIHDPAPAGRYPKVVSRTGASPPQYPDFDEEDEGVVLSLWPRSPKTTSPRPRVRSARVK